MVGDTELEIKPETCYKDSVLIPKKFSFTEKTFEALVSYLEGRGVIMDIEYNESFDDLLYGGSFYCFSRQILSVYHYNEGDHLFMSPGDFLLFVTWKLFYGTKEDGKWVSELTQGEVCIDEMEGISFDWSTLTFSYLSLPDWVKNTEYIHFIY